MLRWATAVVVVHFAITVVHGVAHNRAPVDIEPWQSAFVSIVIVVAPFVGLFLLARDKPVLGGAVIFVSMLGSLIFGVLHHFVLDTLDRVDELPSNRWQVPFVATAVASAVLEVLGAAIGLRIFSRARSSGHRDAR